MDYLYVRRMRLELTRRNRHYPLKVACLPIPPPAREKVPEQDSNLHASRHTHLKRARLPIPPPGPFFSTLKKRPHTASVTDWSGKTGLEPATLTLARLCSTN